MPSDGGLMRLRTDQSGVIVNEGDSIGDDLEPMPAALREMRAETIQISQRIFSRGGESQPAKIWARRQTGKAAEETIGNLFEVTGYFTLLKYLFNRTPREMEGILGLAPQKLSSGADILVIIDELSGNQFAPRYTSAWSAGASPRPSQPRCEIPPGLSTRQRPGLPMGDLPQQAGSGAQNRNTGLQRTVYLPHVLMSALRY